MHSVLGLSRAVVWRLGLSRAVVWRLGLSRACSLEAGSQ